MTNDLRLMVCRNTECAVIIYQQWRQLCPACSIRGITIDLQQMSTDELSRSLANVVDATS